MAGVLALFWLWTAVRNAVCMHQARRHRATTSLLLFLGGVAGGLAMLICPLPGTNWWIWVPAMLDVGSIPAGLAIVYAVATGKVEPEDDAKGSDDNGPNTP